MHVMLACIYDGFYGTSPISLFQILHVIHQSQRKTWVINFTMFWRTLVYILSDIWYCSPCAICYLAILSLMEQVLTAHHNSGNSFLSRKKLTKTRNIETRKLTLCDTKNFDCGWKQILILNNVFFLNWDIAESFSFPIADSVPAVWCHCQPTFGCSQAVVTV